MPFISYMFYKIADLILRIAELPLYLHPHCGVEQLVARWAHNPKVVGSSPTPATKKAWIEDPGFFIGAR